MLQTVIGKLTLEQEALIPLYQYKWRQIALSTGSIDREKVVDIVKSLYLAIGTKEPEILFFDSPYAALKTFSIGEQGLRSQPKKTVWSYLTEQLNSQLTIQLKSLLWNQLWNPLRNQLMSQLQLSRQMESQLGKQKWQQLVSKFHFSIYPEVMACCGSWFDFCFSVLNCTYEPKIWELYQSLVKECGWILPFEKTCIVCDRPIKLTFDHQNRLHAEASPAIQFIDGFSVYAYHGVRLPEEYGKLPPENWQAEWLVKEKNAEVKRALIQGIGYERIYQELQAKELDCWQGYKLLRINKNIDIEPVYLLKMTCPSTGCLYTLRVPPNMKSAREAIRWLNWGIDPEEFSVQT